MATIKKDTLHPEGEPEIDIYPKTSIDQVENLQANLDALNGDIANANGEIANISTNVENIANKVGDINKDVSTLKYNDTNQDKRIQVLENTSATTINRVEIAEKNITVLNTAYGSYTDYTEVTKGFLLTYLSGKQIELPIKAGTNVTFSKYPGSNQIIINSTGGSVPDNIALLDANNTFSGSNTFSKLTYFNNQIALDINPISFNDDTKNMSLVFNYNGFIKRFVDTGNVYSINIPNKTGTIALTTDIPTLADYPTTIFFNNYSAGIGYKDTSTGTIKTVVSTDNNGAQIVLGDSNTGLTLATNARPKVLEDSTVKEVAYVSDIPAAPDNIALLDAANTFTAENTFNQTTYYNNRVFFENSPINLRDSTKKILLTLTYSGFLNNNRGTGDVYSYSFPNKTGTFAVTTDIPSLGNFTFSDNNMNIRGSTVISRSTGSPTEFIFGNYDNTFRSASSGLFTFYNQNAYAVINLEGKTGPQILAFKSDIPNTSSFPTLAGTNNWRGSNIFDDSITTKGNLFVSNGITSYTVNAITRKGYIYTFPDDTGTFALTKNIPTRPQYLQGFGIGTPTYFSFETGIYHTLTITLTDSYKSTSIIIPNDYDGSQIDLDIDGDYFEVTLENEKLSVKITTRDILWLGKLE